MRSRHIISCILLFCLFASCSSDLKLSLISQEEKIDAYITRQFSDSTYTVYRNNGSNRVFIEYVHKQEVDSVYYEKREIRDEEGRFLRDTIVQVITWKPIPIKDTISIDYGDSIYIYYAGYVFNSAPTELFTTNVKEIAQQAKFDTLMIDTDPKGILFEPGVLISGLEYGLHNAKEREHCVILFSAEYGFGNKKQYNIPKLSALAYEIWIDRVVKKKEEE